MKTPRIATGSHESRLRESKSDLIDAIIQDIASFTNGNGWNMHNLPPNLKNRISNIGGIRVLGPRLTPELRDAYATVSTRVNKILHGDTNDSKEMEIELEKLRLSYVTSLEEAIVDFNEWNFSRTNNVDEPTKNLLFSYVRYFTVIYELIPYLSTGILFKFAPKSDEVKMAVYLELKQRPDVDAENYPHKPVIVKIQEALRKQGENWMFSDISKISTYYGRFVDQRGGMKFVLDTFDDDLIFSMTTVHDSEFQRILKEQFRRRGVDFDEADLPELIKFRKATELAKSINEVKFDGKIKPFELFGLAGVFTPIQNKYSTEGILPFLNSSIIDGLEIVKGTSRNLKQKYSDEAETRTKYPQIDLDMIQIFTTFMQSSDASWMLIDLPYELQVSLQEDESYFNVLMDRLPNVVRRNYLPNIQKPVTRGDCLQEERPCPWVSCAHHMIHSFIPEKIAELTVEDLLRMSQTCVLDVIDDTPHGLSHDAIGKLIQVSGARVEQVEKRAFGKLSSSGDALDILYELRTYNHTPEDSFIYHLDALGKD